MMLLPIPIHRKLKRRHSAYADVPIKKSDVGGPEFPQWPQLCDDIKLKIIPMMDYKTRRRLRECSRKDKQLVEKFPWRKEMSLTCRFCKTTERWVCRYYCSIQCRYKCKNYFSPKPVNEIFFDSSEEVYSFMKEVMKTAEKIDELIMDLEFNSKIKLIDGRKLINVRYISLNFIGGENDGTKLECYKFLFSQINSVSLKTVDIDMYWFENNDPMENDDFFELERTSMNLESFNFEGSISEKQLLGIRANQFILANGSGITIPEFIKCVQKQVLQPRPGSMFSIQQLSFDLQIYLFGLMYKDLHPFYVDLLFNLPTTDLLLNISFHLEDETEDHDDDIEDGPFYTVYVDICLRRLDFFPPNPYERNDAAFYYCPCLFRFISEIKKVLPEGFPLLADLRDQN